jgi:hypothetical protein
MQKVNSGPVTPTGLPYINLLDLETSQQIRVYEGATAGRINLSWQLYCDLQPEVSSQESGDTDKSGSNGDPKNKHHHMDKKEFWERLNDLFGYTVPIKRSSRLRTYWLRALENPVTFSTSAEELDPLTVLINWSRVKRIRPHPVLLDPCAGTWNIMRYLAEMVPELKHAELHNNDINPDMPADLCFDCVSPYGWYQAPERVDIFVTSLPFETIDVIAPDLVSRATLFTALHIPGDWVTNGPKYRRLWHSWLSLEENRVCEIRGLERVKGRSTRRCSWLIIFSTRDIKEALWQATTDCFTLFGD